MNKTKIIAIYYPQFHEIEENNIAWGKGFTDWINVKKAEPLYKGHYQPKLPFNNNFYDLSKPKEIVEQVKLAKENKIDGFTFYHYWFDGKVLLDKPLKDFLENKKLDMEFSLSWANETWTKRWVGDSKTIIQEQKHTPDKEIWTNHFYYLLDFFKDERYIRIENKPVFTIYQPILINELNEMLDLWNSLAIKEGLGGIYLMATKKHDFSTKNLYDRFSGVLKFQPQEAYNSESFQGRSKFYRKYIQKLRFLPEKVLDFLHFYKQKFEKHKIFSSSQIFDHILNNAYNKINGFEGDVFESIYVNWDNTPRYNKKATIFTFKTPAVFKEELKSILKKANNSNSAYIFINAWNEWAEGAYLEPDNKFGYKYLECVKLVNNEC